MPDIEFIRGEIERMRAQVARQHRELLQLQRAGASTTAAETLLQRMLDKIDTLCADRDRLKEKQWVTTRVRCWEVGSGEPTIAMVR